MKDRLGQTLFPAEPRYFPGERWLNIALRSAHLVGVAGIGGGFLLDIDPAAWEGYWYLTLVSGVVLVGLYLWATFAWLFEFKGLVIVIKTLLLGGALAFPMVRAEVFVLVVVLSGLIAHAPARVRGARWLDLTLPGNPPSTTSRRQSPRDRRR